MRLLRRFNILAGKYSWCQANSLTTEHFQYKCLRTIHIYSTTKYNKAVHINGITIAQDIKDELKTEVELLVQCGHRVPRMAVILIGDDPASEIYVKNKRMAANYTGIDCDIFSMPSNIEESEVLAQISSLNNEPKVDGILVQLPVPGHLSERRICDAVLPHKDVDGFNVLNVGRFCVDETAFIPATPAGVMEIIRRLNIATFGKKAVVCGRSKNVGLPIAIHLGSDGKGSRCEGDATVTIVHRHTPHAAMAQITRQADILVTATGVPGLISADMVKDGAVVIDVGITRLMDADGRARLVGDVQFEQVCQKAAYITPVPGGVGPVTVAMVIKNTLTAYKRNMDSRQYVDIP